MKTSDTIERLRNELERLEYAMDHLAVGVVSTAGALVGAQEAGLDDAREDIRKALASIISPRTRELRGEIRHLENLIGDSSIR